MHHSPITQGSAHLPEARVPLVPPPSPPALSPPATQNVLHMCGSRSPHVLLGWGSPSRRAPTRTVCVPTWTTRVASVTVSAP
eukprot:7280904-Prymnesium_polylepis.1